MGIALGGDRHLLARLAFAVRREIPASGRVHRRRASRNGAAAGAARIALRRDQVPQSHDLQEAQTPTPAKDIQTAG